MGFIYKITNSSNNKAYIGQTCLTDVNKRWSQHEKAAFDEKRKSLYSTPFYRAIRKYGWDTFTREVVCECSTEQLNEQEILYIEKYNTIYPNGYNLTIGGNSGAKRCPLTVEKMRQSLIERHKKKPMTIESKNKIKNTLLERNSTIRESIDTRNKKSISHRVRGIGLPRYVNVRIFPRKKVYVIGKHPKCKYKQFDNLESCLTYLFLLDNKDEIHKLKDMTENLVEQHNKVSKSIDEVELAIKNFILMMSSETKCQSVVETT